MTTHSVTGAKVHDARIAALLFSHPVTHLLTLNVADFTRYGGLTVVAPGDVIPALDARGEVSRFSRLSLQ